MFKSCLAVCCSNVSIGGIQFIFLDLLSNVVVSGCIKELQNILLSSECIYLFDQRIFNQFRVDLPERNLRQRDIQSIPLHHIA